MDSSLLKPLSCPEELRLVRLIYNGPDWWSARSDHSLKLKLEHKAHGETPYTALSYVWGPEHNSSTILLNGVKVSIRRNLHDALVALRRRKVKSWIWIDALCINQLNHEEKSIQVNRMRDIFEQAETVYGWLGPSMDDSDYLLDWIAQFGKKAIEAGIFEFAKEDEETQSIHVLRFLENNAPALVPEPDDYAQEKLPGVVKHMSRTRPSSMSTAVFNNTVSNPLDRAAAFIVTMAINKPDRINPERKYKAQDALMRREFFRRAWIVQELALSRNSILICGSRSVSADYYDGVLTAQHHYYNLSALRKLRDAWLSLSLLSKGICLELRVWRRLGIYPPSLSHILGISLLESRPFVATDPRDLIFGLLGVAYDAAQLGIQADYSESTREVFTRTTKAFIKSQRGYNLGCSVFPKELSDLPSWVPDWSLIGRAGTEMLPVTYGADFKASLHTRQPGHLIPILDKSPVLRLRGFRLSRLKSILRLPSLLVEHMLLNDKVRFRDQIATYCRENRVLEDSTILRTCLMGECSPLSGITELDPRYFDLAKKVFRRPEAIDERDCSPEDAKLLLSFEKPSGISRESLIQQHFAGFVLNLFDRIARNFLRGRTLFVTDDKSLGMGPNYMAEHDVVTIMLGFDVPILLRPAKGGQYTFVGEAYIDGVMFGEAMGQDRAMEDFEII